MSDPTGLTLAAAREALAARRLSAVELARAHLARMEEARHLNAFLTATPERALAMAEESDRRLAAGTARPLEGIPLAIKDLFCTAGVRTTAASRILGDFTPFYESHVTARLWSAGAVLLGKTNLDEFAMGSANVTSAFGPVANPWSPPAALDDLRAQGGPGGNVQTWLESGGAPFLVPGGSSGGSAAAVAAGLCLGATGTDTGGSIRQPAAFTGIVGMKPTYGRCSRWGIVAFASSLDQAGPMARTVEDCALLLQAMAGHDPADSTSADRPMPDLAAVLGQPVQGLKVGIPREYRVDGMAGEIETVWQKGARLLEDAGCELREIALPHTRFALPTYYILAPAEASSNLARYDGMRYGLRVPGADLEEVYSRSRYEGFGAEVRRRIMIGTYVLSAGYYDAYYTKAQKVRRLIKQDFETAFRDVDVILTPTAPSAAFRLGEKMDDPVAMYLNDVFAVPASLAGLPALSLPGGLSADGLPLGLQLIARAWDEATLFKAASALEAAIGFDTSPRLGGPGR